MSVSPNPSTGNGHSPFNTEANNSPPSTCQSVQPQGSQTSLPNFGDDDTGKRSVANSDYVELDQDKNTLNEAVAAAVRGIQAMSWKLFFFFLFLFLFDNLTFHR